MENNSGIWISGLFNVLGALVVLWGVIKNIRAQKPAVDSQAQKNASEKVKTDVDTIASLRAILNGFAEDREKDAEKIRILTERDDKNQQRMDEMQILIDALGRRIDGLENRWIEVKKWFDLFIAWVEEKGYSGYPPIPKSIKDTHDKMKPVGK